MTGTGRVEILAEDPAFVAVNKASGDLVIPDRFREGGPTLFDRTRDRVGGPLFLVHRLDRGTSGVLLFARTTEAQRELSGLFEHGAVRKTYLALVDGAPAEDSGSIDAPIAAGRKGRMKIAAHGKPSVTRWHVRERFARHALVEAKPETGRTHQIRVHLASIGMPIVGDDRYNFSGAAPLVERLALHAAAIDFALHGREVRIEAPIPDAIAAALARLRSA